MTGMRRDNMNSYPDWLKGLINIAYGLGSLMVPIVFIYAMYWSYINHLYALTGLLGMILGGLGYVVWTMYNFKM